MRQLVPRQNQQSNRGNGVTRVSLQARGHFAALKAAEQTIAVFTSPSTIIMNRPLRTGITILLTAVAFLTSPSTYSQARLQFDISHPYGQISSDLFGIFFEEINHGGEGGLYGEAIVNRSFDDDYGSFYGCRDTSRHCCHISLRPYRSQSWHASEGKGFIHYKWKQGSD